MRSIVNRHPAIRVLSYPALAIRRSYLRKKRETQKKLIEAFCKILVEDPVLKVEEFGGRFIVDRRSDLFARLLIDREYEPRLVKLCRRYCDSQRDVIDVGANIGFFSVLFATLIGADKRVLSVEPTENAIRQLRENLELNGVTARVEVFEGVVSDRVGPTDIKVVKGKEEYSSIGELSHPSVANMDWAQVTVAGSTVDSLVRENSLDPGFLKIDVEGAEQLVFNGARHVLESHRPIILSELSNFLLRKNGTSASEIIKFIHEYEYDVFDPIDPSITPGKKEFGDVICFPKEMQISFQ